MKKVYYAHPVTLYHSIIETIDVTTLKRAGFGVINPNSPECDEGYKRFGMMFFDRLVKSADVLAFRAFPDGKIPAGILHEIYVAEGFGLPIFEMPRGAFKSRGLDVEETRHYLLEMGRRA